MFFMSRCSEGGVVVDGDHAVTAAKRVDVYANLRLWRAAGGEGFLG